jgi:hypothetical protein
VPRYLDEQVLRFHARQVLRPVGEDPRSYEVEFFAPLAGFILAPSGQSQMSVTVRSGLSCVKSTNFLRSER